jgi:hypothetical protein
MLCFLLYLKNSNYMRKSILFLTTIISHHFINAQDTIIKNNGEQIISKILEVNPVEIKYKKFDFQSGPTYVESKTDVQAIKYSNGSKDVYQPGQPSKTTPSSSSNIDSSPDYYGGSVQPTKKIEVWGSRYKYENRIIKEKELQNVLMQTKDKKIMAAVQQAKTAKGLQYIGFAAIPLGIASLVFLTASVPSSTSNNTRLNPDLVALSGVCLIGAVACPIASGIFKHKRTLSNREAVRLYNEKY